MLVSVVRQLAFESLYHKRSAPSATAVFADQRHNRDLCPRTQQQCDDLLRAVKRQRSVAYDIQGPKDAGTDIVIVIGGEERQQYIGIQVKSDIEATKGVYDKIKAQYVDASEKYRDDLLDYYVLLCWNQATREHMVRKVNSDFAGIERVRVVDPVYALTFLNMAPREFDSILRTTLGEADPMVRNARSSVDHMTYTQLAVFLHALSRHVEGKPLVNAQYLAAEPHLKKLYELALALGDGEHFRVPPSVRIPEELLDRHGERSITEAIASDLEAMSEIFDVNEESDVAVSLDGFEAILALAYEAIARSEYEGADLVEYLEGVLLPSGAGSEARRDALSLALNSMIDRFMHDEESISLLLEANFDSPQEARAILLPDDAEIRFPEIDKSELTWEELALAVTDVVYRYGELEDVWSYSDWATDECYWKD